MPTPEALGAFAAAPADDALAGACVLPSSAVRGFAADAPAAVPVAGAAAAGAVVVVAAGRERDVRALALPAPALAVPPALP
jgi:hypothetical protein